MNGRHPLERNLLVARALAFFQVFMVIVPVAVPLFGSRGLDISMVLELQALFGLTVLLAELPSGYIADLYGRRVALVLGSVFLGVGHTLLLFAHDFASLALFEIALGIGVSLISGADVALLFDSQLALGHDEDRRQRGLGSLFFAKALSEAGAGIAAFAVLWVASLDDLVVVQVIVGWIPLLLAVWIVEPPVERISSATHLDNLLAVLRSVFGAGVIVRRTFLMMAVWSVTTFYAVWLLQHHWQEDGVPLYVFGLMWALLAVVGGYAGRHAADVERRFGAHRLIVMVSLLPAAGFLLLAHAAGYWALLVALLFPVARGMGFVVLQNALNRRLASSHRATANSLVGFGFRASFAITVPVMGVLLEIWSLSAVFQLLAVATVGIFLGIGLPLSIAVRRLPLPGTEMQVVDSAGQGGPAAPRAATEIEA